ncbi:MAG TPA: hypothetical protein VD838_12260, partial [Anaeromyxobacteraceae bacterium]|nr:hypothetical protein [Anaeromyxobacteraceae bacterium]
QEIAATRLTLIYEKAGKAVGDLDRTLEGNANQGRRLAAIFREMRDGLAVGLTSAIEDFTDRMNDAVGDGEGLRAWAERTGEQLGELLLAVVDLSTAFVQLGLAVAKGGLAPEETASDAENMEQALDDLTQTVETLTAALQGLRKVAGVLRLAFDLATFDSQALARAFGMATDRAAELEARGESAGRIIEGWGDKMDVAAGKADNLAYAAAAASGALAQLAVFMATTNGDLLGNDAEFTAMLRRVLALQGAVSSLQSSGGGGGGRAGAAGESAEERAKRLAELRVERAREVAEMEAEAMAEGTEKVVRQIRLDFQRRREAYLEAYKDIGGMSPEVARLFLEMERAAVTAAITGDGGALD